jgi:hypothetical protein
MSTTPRDWSPCAPSCSGDQMVWRTRAGHVDRAARPSTAQPPLLYQRCGTLTAPAAVNIPTRPVATSVGTLTARKKTNGRFGWLRAFLPPKPRPPQGRNEYGRGGTTIRTGDEGVRGALNGRSRTNGIASTAATSPSAHPDGKPQAARRTADVQERDRGCRR